MESKRRHFRLDVTDKNIIAKIKNKKGEEKELKVFDISKQGISFYLEDWVVMQEWKKNIEVEFEYEGRVYDFGINFIREFKVKKERFYAAEFDGKNVIKMSQLSLQLMKEKLNKEE